eukprot:jgi/Psemu1/304735/fgenesh1_kg.167_\
MIRSPLVASTTRFLVRLSVLLLVATTSTTTSTTTSLFADATATATATKTHAATLPETKHDQGGTRYMVSSSFRDCSESESESELEGIGGELSVAVSETGSETETATSPRAFALPKWKATYRWYLRACAETPFRAKGLTSATIAALGDAIAQKIERRQKATAAASVLAFNPSRCATFFFCNLLFTGPFIHLWYTFLNNVGQQLEKRVRNISNLKKTVAQVFLDQTVGTFAFFPLYIYAYNCFESVIQKHRLPVWSHATEQCQKHMWDIIKTQYRVFPFSNMINFGLVPLELRVLFTSTVSLFWNIYVSSVVG